MSNDLTIPVALTDDGRIVHAHEGDKAHAFRCPGCKDTVVWRRCDDVNRRSHFAHRPDAPCSESALHAAAKILVAQSINDWLGNRGRRPLVVPACAQCLRDCEARPFEIDIRSSATIESTLESGLRPDVLVGSMAVEVLHKHPIGSEKIDQYAKDGISWIEVHADGVLADPAAWRLNRASDGQSICYVCSRATERDRLHREVVELEKRLPDLRERVKIGTAKVAEVTQTVASLEASLKQRYEESRKLAGKIATQERELVLQASAELTALRAEVAKQKRELLQSTNAELIALRAECARVTGDLETRRRELEYERSKIVQFLASPCTPDCLAARALRGSRGPRPVLLATGTQ